jgi:hypothetical protein
VRHLVGDLRALLCTCRCLRPPRRGAANGSEHARMVPDGRGGRGRIIVPPAADKSASWKLRSTVRNSRKTRAPALCSALHGYSACDTSGSKAKCRRCRTRSRGGRNRHGWRLREARVVAKPCGCGPVLYRKVNFRKREFSETEELSLANFGCLFYVQVGISLCIVRSALIR